MTVALVSAALPVTGLMGAPAQADEGTIVITGIEPVNDAGGLSGHLPIACSVVVRFTDETPAVSLDRYRLTVTDSGGRVVDSAEAQEGEEGSYFFAAGCDSFVADEASTVKVEEVDGAGDLAECSVPEPFTLEVTGHPTAAANTSEMVAGRWTNFVERPASIAFEGGWEAGSRFSTRVWTSRTADFTPDDWDDNVNGDAALVDVSGTEAPVLTFTPRRRDVGRFVWISIIGQKSGKAAYRYTFDPEYVAPGTQPTSRWYSSFGATQGAPRVRRTVRVTAPALTAEGAKSQISVSYRWLVNGRTIPGATRSTYRVPRKYLRRTLSVRAVFRSPGYVAITRSWTLGRVRR